MYGIARNIKILDLNESFGYFWYSYNLYFLDYI